MKRLVRWAAFFGGIAAAACALAHATMNRAVPAVGSVVHASPVKVELWFSENLEPAFTTLKVFDGAGRQVDKKDKSIDGGDRRHVLVSLAPLAPGTYRVVWHALSADAHVTEGDFTFRVAP